MLQAPQKKKVLMEIKKKNNSPEYHKGQTGEIYLQLCGVLELSTDGGDESMYLPKFIQLYT